MYALLYTCAIFLSFLRFDICYNVYKSSVQYLPFSSVLRFATWMFFGSSTLIFGLCLVFLGSKINQSDACQSGHGFLSLSSIMWLLHVYKSQLQNCPSTPTPGLSHSQAFDLRLILYSGAFDAKLCHRGRAVDHQQKTFVSSQKLKGFVLIHNPFIHWKCSQYMCQCTHIMPQDSVDYLSEEIFLMYYQ